MSFWSFTSFWSLQFQIQTAGSCPGPQSLVLQQGFNPADINFLHYLQLPRTLVSFIQEDFSPGDDEQIKTPGLQPNIFSAAPLFIVLSDQSTGQSMMTPCSQQGFNPPDIKLLHYLQLPRTLVSFIPEDFSPPDIKLLHYLQLPRTLVRGMMNKIKLPGFSPISSYRVNI
jgi:hypothetical protein